MDSFINLLSRLAKLESRIQELVTRSSPIQRAMVTDIDEPRRMIKVSRESQGGRSAGHWIYAGRRSPFEDEPIPPIGTTVLVAYVNADPHDGVYLRTIANATNPPDTTQAHPKDDNTVQIPGDEQRLVNGWQEDRVVGDRTTKTGGVHIIECTNDIDIDSIDGNIEVTALNPSEGRILLKAFNRVRLQDGSGAYIQMQGGLIEVRDRFGRQWTLGGANWTFDLNGAALRIINASDVSINGKSVAVVDALDSDGDVLINRGY